MGTGTGTGMIAQEGVETEVCIAVRSPEVLKYLELENRDLLGIILAMMCTKEDAYLLPHRVVLKNELADERTVCSVCSAT